MKYFIIYLIFFVLLVGVIQEADARSADEPCSYLKPTKYVKDSNGNCMLAPQIQQVAPTTIPNPSPPHTSSATLPVSTISAPVSIPTSSIPSLMPETIHVIIFFVGLLAIIGIKVYAGKSKKQRMRWQPSQHENRKQWNSWR
jgi:hypothetical protein